MAPNPYTTLEEMVRLVPGVRDLFLVGANIDVQSVGEVVLAASTRATWILGNSFPLEDIEIIAVKDSAFRNAVANIAIAMAYERKQELYNPNTGTFPYAHLMKRGEKDLEEVGKSYKETIPEHTGEIDRNPARAKPKVESEKPRGW
jgi:hypothetical protein